MSVNSFLKKFFSKVEKALSPRTKIAIGVGALILGGYGIRGLFGTTSMPDSTVMITNLAKTSGGSGVILSSGKVESKILTNAHICAVVERGGWVRTSTDHEYLVESYVVSPDHDICLVKVKSDLKVNTEVASSPPQVYDAAHISGHPALLPNIVSDGHFAARKVIQLVKGFKQCEEADYRTPDGAFYCMFFGVIPILKSYESVVVTALIMGGSSGSAVYNWRNQIVGLAFAGHGKSLSFAFIVPYEFLVTFLANVDTYPVSKPQYTLTLTELINGTNSEDSFSEDFRKAKIKCTNTNEGYESEELLAICNSMESSTLWLKEY